MNTFSASTDFLLANNPLEDFSFLYPSWFQDSYSMTETHTTAINNNNKRRRKEQQPNNNEENPNKVLKELLTSLLLSEEQQQETKPDSSMLDFNQNNNNKQTQVLVNHQYSDNGYQSFSSDFDESDQFLLKRPHLMNQVVAQVAVNPKSKDSGIGNGNGGGGGAGGSGQHRRLWVKDRSKAWWDQCNHPDFPESEFRKAFRMSRATFDLICQELNTAVAKENTMLRDAIPVRQRVAVCIWRLATGDPLRLVSKRFGLGISTCHKLVLEVCSAIKTVLMPKYLKWPTEERMNNMKDEFESISNIPNVVGSMYTTHIPIIAPKTSVSAYFNKRHTERNQKTSYSITIQGVVDPRGVFSDVFIGWPGSVPDDQVLEKSVLYQRANGGELNGVWIVGSSAYPLMDWVLVPYSQQNLTWTQHAFNQKIGEVQGIAKDAFARLKGRWACLQKRTEMKLQDLPVVLGACCVLHNICEMMNDEMDTELTYDLFDDEMVAENGVRSMSSMRARDGIAHNLLHSGLASTGFL